MMSVIGIGIGIGVTAVTEDNEKAYLTTVGVLSVSSFLEPMLQFTRYITLFYLSLFNVEHCKFLRH